MEPLHEFRMRGLELRAFLYELPQFAGGLIAGLAAGYIFYYLFTHHPEWSANAHRAIFGGLAALGMGGIFWGASYLPKRALLFNDRVRFIMAFSSREVSYAEIVSVRALSLEETRKTFFSPRHVSMTPCLNGAVELRRKRGRAWVFSVEDQENFVARINELVGKVKDSTAPDAEVTRP